MGHHVGHIVERVAGVGNELLEYLGVGLHREVVHRAAVHLDEQILRRCLAGLIGIGRAAGRADQRLRAGALGTQDRVQDTPVASLWICLHDNGTRSVSEEHARSPVFPVRDLGELFGSDDEYVAIGAG